MLPSLPTLPNLTLRLTSKLGVLAGGHGLERRECVRAVHLDEEVEARLVVEGADLVCEPYGLLSVDFLLVRNVALNSTSQATRSDAYLEERLTREGARLGPERATAVAAELALHRLA